MNMDEIKRKIQESTVELAQITAMQEAVRPKREDAIKQIGKSLSDAFLDNDVIRAAYSSVTDADSEYMTAKNEYDGARAGTVHKSASWLRESMQFQFHKKLDAKIRYNHEVAKHMSTLPLAEKLVIGEYLWDTGHFDPDNEQKVRESTFASEACALSFGDIKPLLKTMGLIESMDPRYRSVPANSFDDAREQIVDQDSKHGDVARVIRVANAIKRKHEQLTTEKSYLEQALKVSKLLEQTGSDFATVVDEMPTFVRHVKYVDYAIAEATQHIGVTLETEMRQMAGMEYGVRVNITRGTEQATQYYAWRDGYNHKRDRPDLRFQKATIAKITDDSVTLELTSAVNTYRETFQIKYSPESAKVSLAEIPNLPRTIEEALEAITPVVIPLEVMVDTGKRENKTKNHRYGNFGRKIFGFIDKYF